METFQSQGRFFWGLNRLWWEPWILTSTVSIAGAILLGAELILVIIYFSGSFPFQSQGRFFWGLNESAVAHRYGAFVVSIAGAILLGAEPRPYVRVSKKPRVSIAGAILLGAEQELVAQIVQQHKLFQSQGRFFWGLNSATTKGAPHAC